MKLDNMFKKSQAISGKEPEKEAKAEVPEGLLRKCNLCKKVIFAEDVEKGKNAINAAGQSLRKKQKNRIISVRNAAVITICPLWNVSV